MGRRWQAFLAMVPPTVTHNDLEAYMRRGRGGRMVPSIRKSEALHEAEEAIRARVLAAGVPERPLSGALREEVTVCYPPGQAHADGEPHTDKPDLDNLVKTLNDVAERCGVVADDREVAALSAAKAWSEPAGIWLAFEEVRP